jgi:hypothetical protein
MRPVSSELFDLRAAAEAMRILDQTARPSQGLQEGSRGTRVFGFS